MVGSLLVLIVWNQASGMTALMLGVSPGTLVMWPLPVRSSTRRASPGLKVCFVPSPSSISMLPDREMMYCRRGAGCPVDEMPRLPLAECDGRDGHCLGQTGVVGDPELLEMRVPVVAGIQAVDAHDALLWQLYV